MSHLRALYGPAEPETATGKDFRRSCLIAGCRHPSLQMMLQCHMDVLTSGLDDKRRKIELFKGKKHVCKEEKSYILFIISTANTEEKNGTALQER